MILEEATAYEDVNRRSLDEFIIIERNKVLENGILTFFHESILLKLLEIWWE